ncbi:WD40-repeat-containing domain protein [Scleroderma yunnanense]
MGKPAVQVEKDTIINNDEQSRTRIVTSEIKNGRNHVSQTCTAMTMAADTAWNANSAWDQVTVFNTTSLRPLNTFRVVVNAIANIHPYAKVALGTLSWTAQTIITQVNLDKSMDDLLRKISQVYEFLMEDTSLIVDASLKDTLTQLVVVINECAQFIRTYSETTNLWRGLGKNTLSETSMAVAKYSEVLDTLIQQFRDRATCDIHVWVHQTLSDFRYLRNEISQTGNSINLEGIAYAAGAGFDATKTCLEGTRTDLLAEIVDWINSPEPDCPCVFWLHGQAGKGKSAIAHTIANWFNELGGLGACFCFTRDRYAEHRHEKLFTTIAHDLADREPMLKRALAGVLADDYSLKTTPDAMQQWQKLILQSLSKLSSPIIGPVLIIIDALDESGAEVSRRDILRILSSAETNLPANFRILLTSRPLPDICNALCDAKHVKAKSIDTVVAVSTYHDIRLYISDQLQGLSRDFHEDEVALLARRSDGLFEWARLACEFIRSQTGSTPKERYDNLISRDPGESESLLDGMYHIILRDVVEPTPRALSRFRSVMHQILCTMEPLPIASLTAMRRNFRRDSDRCDVGVILKCMAPLLSGITDASRPIRPLHSSFHDFLTDASRSEEFFVDILDTHLDLAYSSLRILQKDLRFNICKLESSYMRNSEIVDLASRVRDNISPHLSYSCPHWGSHLHDSAFEASVAKEVERFFKSEQILFWLEALSLLRELSNARVTLDSAVRWAGDEKGHECIAEISADVLRFIRTFGGAISQSTPHLYLSALPFCPKDSFISIQFSLKFPRIPQVVRGRDIHWPISQVTIKEHTSTVTTVAFSPDGTRIVSGSDDHTIRLWDAETGLTVGSSLEGHTERVYEVMFSPDGKCVVSGSCDSTIRIWDVEKGLQVGEPLQGHTEWVITVAYSPNGRYIASGSRDTAIIIWDAETGQKIGDALLGHTGWVYSVCFSPDGKRIVSGGDDNLIRIWDVETGLQECAPLEGHVAPIFSVVFSPGGQLIASGSVDSTIRLWDSETGAQVRNIFEGHNGSVYSIAFSPDGKRILSSSDDQTVRMWDVKTGVQVGNAIEGHSECVLTIAWSPDGKRIVSGGADNTIRVWDAETRSAPRNGHVGHSSAIYSIAFSPDGKKIVSGSRDQTVRVWDTQTGLQLGNTFEVHTDWVLSVAISPDGKLIASGSRDSYVCLMDIDTGHLVHPEFEGHTAWVFSVAFSPDSQRVVSSSSDTTIRTWDVDTGLQIGIPFAGRSMGFIYAIAFSPDGKKIVSGARDWVVRLWDAETGLQVGKSFQGHTDAVHCVAFSPDGKRIVSGSSDTTLRLWDPETGSQVGSHLAGHQKPVMSAAFSPDGKFIVSASDDGTIRMWDAGTGLQVHCIQDGHAKNWIFPVIFSPDGKLIASAGNDCTIRLWDARIRESRQGQSDNPTSSSIAPDEGHLPICFSSTKSHALDNSNELFDGVDAKDDWRNLVHLGPDGWITGPHDRLLLWVPPTGRAWLYMPCNILIIPRGGIELDLSVMSHGRNWEQCLRC